MPAPIRTYKDFWPHYLKEHSKPGTQKIHAVGSFGGVAALGLAIATQTWWLPLAGIAFGYAAAWTSHFFIEKNKPATFGSPRYAAWSFISDFRMSALWTAGQLKKEFARFNLKIDASEKRTAAAKPEAPKI